MYNCCRTSAKKKYVFFPSKKPSLTHAESGNDLTKLAGQGRGGGGGGGGDNFGSPPPLGDDVRVDAAMAGGTPLHTPLSSEETTDAEDDDHSIDGNRTDGHNIHTINMGEPNSSRSAENHQSPSTSTSTSFDEVSAPNSTVVKALRE